LVLVDNDQDKIINRIAIVSICIVNSYQLISYFIDNIVLTLEV